MQRYLASKGFKYILGEEKFTDTKSYATLVFYLWELCKGVKKDIIMYMVY